MSAPDTAPAAGVVDAVDRLRADVQDLLDRGLAGEVPERTLQALTAMAAKLLVAQREAGADVSPLDGHELTATEVLVTASGMLKAANLEVFELTMWNGFSAL